MNLLLVLMTLLLSPTLSLAQDRAVEPVKPVYNQAIDRNFELEQEATIRANKLAQYLEPEALAKLDRITQVLLRRNSGRADIDYYLTTQRLVRESFPNVSSKQVDLLTFYTLYLFLDELKERLSKTNDLSEMESLRLQMTLDRRSKFISTLSQVMKKISTTQDMLVQNTK